MGGRRSDLLKICYLVTLVGALLMGSVMIEANTIDRVHNLYF